MRCLLILLNLLILYGCIHSGVKENSKPTTIHFQDSLITPDHIKTFSRTTANTNWIPNDTITKCKNFIKYLKSDDSCCSDNLYINWGNDSINRIFISQNTLQYRSYFTPTLIKETKDYLILEHGCATDCQAILFLPLNNRENTHDILDVVKFNSSNYIVIRSIQDVSKVNEHMFVEAINVKNNKSKRFVFKYSGICAHLPSLIDSCNITDDEIFIRAQLYDRVKEKKVVESLRIKNEVK